MSVEGHRPHFQQEKESFGNIRHTFKRHPGTEEVCDTQRQANPFSKTLAVHLSFSPAARTSPRLQKYSVIRAISEKSVNVFIATLKQYRGLGVQVKRAVKNQTFWGSFCSPSSLRFFATRTVYTLSPTHQLLINLCFINWWLAVSYSSE